MSRLYIWTDWLFHQTWLCHKIVALFSPSSNVNHSHQFSHFTTGKHSCLSVDGNSDTFCKRTTLCGTHVTFLAYQGLALIGLTCWNVWGWTSIISYSCTTTLTPWWSGSLTILDYCEGLMVCGWQIMCVSVYTRRKSLSYSLPRRRAASPRILIQHASPEDDRYPSVEPPQLRPQRAWLMPSNLIPSWSISKKVLKVLRGWH